MKILTIVVTKNGVKYIDRCLQSIEDSDVHTDCIVIDNFSRDTTVDYVKEHYPWTDIVCSHRRSSFSKMNNIGFRKGLKEDYDYFLLVHQNAYLYPDTISQLLTEAQKNLSGIFSPVLLNHTGDELEEGFSDYISYKTLANIDNEGRSIPPFRSRFVNMAVWLIPASVLKRVGGFDPIFNHFGEDLDWINRLYYFKYSIKVVPLARAIYDRPAKSFSKKEEMYRQQVYFMTQMKNINMRLGDSMRFSIAAPYKDLLLAFYRREWKVVMGYLKMIIMLNWNYIPALISRYTCRKGIRPFL